jgi:glycosyltransferase involved in cell wall biosynthesis
MYDSTELPAVVHGPGVPGLVSVVIPTYNREYIIRGAIASALCQLGIPVEVVVADDGSRDGTAAIVADVARAAGDIFGEVRVRYVRQENAGVAAARNLGMCHARGEFVAFLDSDDQWHPWKLAAQLGVLRALPDVGMVWTDMAAVGEDGRVTHPRYLRTMYDAHAQVSVEALCRDAGMLASYDAQAPTGVREARVLVGDIFPGMLVGNLVHTSTVLLRRDRVARSGGFDEALRPSGEDYEFHLRTSALGPVALIDAPSTLYRVGAPDQLTGPSFGVAIARNDLRTMLRWRDEAKERRVTTARALRRRVGHSYAWLGEELLRSGDRPAAASALLRSMLLRPTLRELAFLTLSVAPVSLTAFAYKLLALLRELDFDVLLG